MKFIKVSGIEFRRCLSLAQDRSDLVREGCYLRDLEVYLNSYCFLSEDGLTGIAVTYDMEAISLFNVGKPGMGEAAVQIALDWGADHLVCEMEMTWYYKKFGFDIEEWSYWEEDVRMELGDI